MGFKRTTLKNECNKICLGVGDAPLLLYTPN